MEAQTILLVVVTIGRTALIDCWPLWVTIVAAMAAQRFVHFLYELPPLIAQPAVEPIAEESTQGA